MTPLVKFALVLFLTPSISLGAELIVLSAIHPSSGAGASVRMEFDLRNMRAEGVTDETSQLVLVNTFNFFFQQIENHEPLRSDVKEAGYTRFREQIKGGFEVSNLVMEKIRNDNLHFNSPVPGYPEHTFKSLLLNQLTNLLAIWATREINEKPSEGEIAVVFRILNQQEPVTIAELDPLIEQTQVRLDMIRDEHYLFQYKQFQGIQGPLVRALPELDCKSQIIQSPKDAVEWLTLEFLIFTLFKNEMISQKNKVSK